MIKLSKSEKGFTLVELMIVITVIAILATIGVVSFTRVQAQTRDTKRKADLRALSTALQAHFTEKNAYPTVNGAPGGLTGLTPTYIPSLPTPPLTSLQTNYTYNVNTSNQYTLCALMETQGSVSYWKVSTLNAGGVTTDLAGCVAE